MKLDLNSNTAIYLQIAQIIEDGIFEKIYQEEEKVPSINDFSKILNINPHTVLKGVNLLVDQELLYKKRGLGMFVKIGALNKIKEKRANDFNTKFIKKIISESKKLEISKAELIELIRGGYDETNN